MKNNKILKLLGIEIFIIHAGMVRCSGWKLDSAVSNAGGLRIIGSGSMYSDNLRENISKCKNTTNKPFGVNIPLMYPQIEDHINVIMDEGVKIVLHQTVIRKIGQII